MVKKHIIDIDEDTWREVLKHQLDMKADYVNDAVLDLIKLGLKKGGK